MTDAVPHFDQEAEEAVIGAALILGDFRSVSGLLARGLRPEHFYRAEHGLVFSAMASLADRASAIDPITVSAELERLGRRGEIDRGRIEYLSGCVPSASHGGAYADRVIELARWRKRERATYELQAAIEKRDQRAWARAQADLESAVAGTRTETYSGEQWAALLLDYFLASPEEVAEYAVPLPFRRLTDALGGGLAPGESLALSGPTYHGKALALSTPVLTTDGWSEMGDLRPGARVFGADGRPTRIVAVTAPMLGHDCFEVEFSDGARIVADADHLWAFEINERVRTEGAAVGGRRRRPGRQERVSLVDTTAELAERVARSTRMPRVRLPGPIQRPEARLSVSPYLLGLWLGDGSHRGGSITMGSEDAYWVADVLRREGETVGVRSYDGRATLLTISARPDLCRRGHVRRGRWNRCCECHAAQVAGRDLGDSWNVSLAERLRDLGVLWPAPKRIPVAYLESSAEQRLALLRGLVDSDGSVGPTGWVEITSTLPRLAEDVVELVASLGSFACVSEKRLVPGKRGTDRAWRIQFTLADPPARLPRKRDRWLPPSDRRHYRYVRAVRPVPSVPVRCISVEAPDGLFLAGRELVPTHNSMIADQWLDHAAGEGKRCHLYMTEMTAVNRGLRYLARQTGVPFLRQRARRTLTDEDRRKIIAELQRRVPYGCSIAADWDVEDIVRDALRARYDFVVIDLLHGFHYEDERGLDRLSKAVQRLARVSTTLDGHKGTAVCAVTHLKEEGQTKGRVPRPTISSIKGGSSIKQDCDFVVFVWQEQEEGGAPNGEAEVWIAKGRSGQMEKEKLRLSPRRFMFVERADEIPGVTAATAQAF